jgi:hypothetical protein
VDFVAALGHLLAAHRMRTARSQQMCTLDSTRLTRLDILKSLVGHDCGVGEGSQAVRCELECVGGGGILWIRRVCSWGVKELDAKLSV